MERFLAEDPGIPSGGVEDAGRAYLILGIVLGVTLLAFWPTWVSLPGVWQRYNYGHGYLILGAVAWLLWRQRSVALHSTSGLPDLIPLIALLSVGWLLALISGLGVVHQGMMVLLLFAFAVASFGRPAARTLAPIAATFLLAVPLWEVMIPILRPLTVLVSGTAARWVGIPAEIQDFYVTIPDGTFFIDQGCSGVAFFLAGLSIGAIYALFLESRWMVQIAIVLVATSISIASNWIRVWGLIVIGHRSSMEAELLYDHGTFGWLIFVAGLVPTFLLARRLQKWKVPARSRAKAPREGG